MQERNVSTSITSMTTSTIISVGSQIKIHITLHTQNIAYLLVYRKSEIIMANDKPPLRPFRARWIAACDPAPPGSPTKKI